MISNRDYARRRRDAEYYPVSMSCRTVVYKGMVLVDQLGALLQGPARPALRDRARAGAPAFRDQHLPVLALAHPYRMVAHNGEINTLRGNVNWMAARQASVDSELFGNDISKLWPISYEGQSDTACFDNALEFLVRGGYSLTHAMMMLIPEAWAGNPLMDEERRALLRISRLDDGAVGRPRGDGLHRRPPDRRHAGPQRPAARALFRHRRRPCRARLRNGRAAGA